MALIKSISGIRGTIGGKRGSNLTPDDILQLTIAYGWWLSKNSTNKNVILGRDARPSGVMISNIVSGALQSMGFHIIDLGLSTTPTVEFAVIGEDAAGGIIITASHNPKEWNALKLLNQNGEFLSANEAQQVLEGSNNPDVDFAPTDLIGSVVSKNNYLDTHIEAITNLSLVDIDSIKSRNFKVAVDGINSSGGLAVPKLLKKLGVSQIKEINCTPDGNFKHNPEPLEENISEILSLLQKGNYDLGIIVDPDVDRLAMVSEDGSFFGEEYTLVAVADYVLSKSPGNTVSNLSSSRALKDITEKYKGTYYASAVGEVNVVEKMKEVNAVIGGEGNGGVIYPQLHYGRDALVGIALFLTHLSKFNGTAAQLRSSYPSYYIRKHKLELSADLDIKKILNYMQDHYGQNEINTTDGIRIDFETEWVHLRKSNTEPVIRIIAESITKEKAEALALRFVEEVENLTLQTQKP